MIVEEENKKRKPTTFPCLAELEGEPDVIMFIQKDDKGGHEGYCYNLKSQEFSKFGKVSLNGPDGFYKILLEGAKVTFIQNFSNGKV